jgi:hypothetical protein
VELTRVASADEWCGFHQKPKFACDDLPHVPPHPRLDYELNPDLGPVAMAAIEFHGVYNANVEAGFTPPQALYLLAVQMTGNPGIAPGLDLPEPPA